MKRSLMLNNFPLIIADENTDARIIQSLIYNGYHIFSVQQLMPGISDAEIIKYAWIKGGFILTEDKDFGDELVYQKKLHHGALLLRLAGVGIDEKVRLILIAFQKHSHDFINSFSVLSKNKLRIRK